MQNTREHGAEHEGWEVMVEVEHSAHDPERRKVKPPPHEQPHARRQLFAPQCIVLGLPLLQQKLPRQHHTEQPQQHQVAPPDHRVAQQVDSICAT